MGIVDDYYYKWAAELGTDIAGKSLIADLAGIATSAAATAAGGNEVKTILSAISTGVQGFSKSVDSNILAKNTVQTIRVQMDASRTQIAADIHKGMKSSSTDYPLEAGLQDIIKYYDAGSLNAGLAALSNSASQSKTKADTDLKNVK